MDYTVEFRTVASRSGWPKAPLADTFLHGRADYIKDLLIAYGRPPSLDGVIELAIQLDLRVQTRGHNRQLSHPFLGPRSRDRASPPTTTEPGPEPIQLGRALLTPEERRCRRRANLCMYCGGEGHFVATCPSKGLTHL